MGQKRTAARSAQWPLLAEFVINWDDTMVDVTGAPKDFKTAGASNFDIINLPPGAIIQGGEVVVETAFAGSTTVPITLGDSVNATRYLGSTSLMTLARTAIVPTGYVGQGENIRMNFAPTGALATAGKASVRVWYSIRDRANETIPN
jgi:hypothetical protein